MTLLRRLQPPLNDMAWSALLSLHQHGEMGQIFTRDFALQSTVSKHWQNPIGVAICHVREKWEWLKKNFRYH